MRRFISNLIDKLGSARWLAIPAGAGMVFFSAFLIWFLFATKNFSSAVRDEFEEPPGPIEYVLFALGVSALLCLLWLGLCSIALGCRRNRDT